MDTASDAGYGRVAGRRRCFYPELSLRTIEIVGEGMLRNVKFWRDQCYESDLLPQGFVERKLEAKNLRKHFIEKSYNIYYVT